MQENHKLFDRKLLHLKIQKHLKFNDVYADEDAPEPSVLGFFVCKSNSFQTMKRFMNLTCNLYFFEVNLPNIMNNDVCR